MDDVRDRVRRELERLDPSPGGLDKTLRRIRRRERNRRVSAGGLGLMLTAALGVGLWLSFGHLAKGPGPAASESPSPLVVPQGRIAYLCEGAQGIPDICVMNTDGTGRTTLSGAPPGWEPAASPDGTRIAYRGYHAPFNEGDYDLYVTSTDGTQVSRLTFGTLPDNPAWSPDGSRIAFGTSGDGSIDVVNADGSGLTRLTEGGPGGVEDEYPTWSPDGTRIAFARAHLGKRNWQIYVMNADGTGITQLTSQPAVALDPEWSPDGARITFLQYRGGGFSPRDIYVMNADGTCITRLTTEGDNSNAVWVDGGREIAFLSRRDGSTGLYLMRADGSDKRLLISHFPDIGGGEFDWLR